MSVATIIYLAEISDNASKIFLFIFSLIVLLYAFLLLTYFFADEHGDEEKYKLKSMSKKVLISLAFLATCFVALPSKETVYMMSIVSNDKVQSITTNALDVIDQKIKEIKKEGGSK